jgi:hypothetical protein
MIVDPTVHHEKGTSKSPAVWRVKEEVGSVGHPATLHSKEAVKNFSDQHRKCGQKKYIPHQHFGVKWLSLSGPEVIPSMEGKKCSAEASKSYHPPFCY